MSIQTDFVAKERAADQFDAARKVVDKFFGKLPPIFRNDLNRFAQQNGIEIRRSGSLNYEGMIERDAQGKATIHLRTGLNLRRERFTLAHELGHWLLQEELIGTMNGQLFRGVSRNEAEMKDEERLASLLAAEILMPFDEVLSCVEPERKLKSVDAICAQFGVSRTAAVRRIADVANFNLVSLQLVPYRFHDLKSLTQVDDALFVSARRATLYAPERTRLRERIVFEELVAEAYCLLCLESPKGELARVFELTYRTTPIPHVLALASVDQWPN